MAGHTLRARWGQPVTGIVSCIVFFLIAWLIWFIFSDPRGPVASFPYPFVMYLAMMILVGLWQHMFMGDWPFQDLPQPARGIIETVVNLALVWFVIHVVFYRILGVGFNFFSQVNLEALAAAGQTAIPEVCGKTLTLQALTDPVARFGERAVVTFVLIGFFSYPFVTILFAKWPIRPSDLTQPQAGLAELGWCSLLTLFFFTILIVPFWGVVYGKVFGTSFGLNLPLVGRDCRHRSRALGLWLVGMGHYRPVHDPQRLADETLVGDHPAPALEGTDFVCSHHRPRLYPGPDLCKNRPRLVTHGRRHPAFAGRGQGHPHPVSVVPRRRNRRVHPHPVPDLASLF